MYRPCLCCMSRKHCTYQYHLTLIYLRGRNICTSKITKSRNWQDIVDIKNITDHFNLLDVFRSLMYTLVFAEQLTASFPVLRLMMHPFRTRMRQVSSSMMASIPATNAGEGSIPVQHHSFNTGINRSFNRSFTTALPLLYLHSHSHVLLFCYDENFAAAILHSCEHLAESASTHTHTTITHSRTILHTNTSG